MNVVTGRFLTAAEMKTAIRERKIAGRRDLSADRSVRINFGILGKVRVKIPLGHDRKMTVSIDTEFVIEERVVCLRHSVFFDRRRECGVDVEIVGGVLVEECARFYYSPADQPPPDELNR